MFAQALSVPWHRTAQTLVTGFLLIALAVTNLTPTYAAPFDGKRQSFLDGRFGVVWTRTDAEQVRGGRTWYWGPGGWFDYAEFYRESPNSLRMVQYFDKARMELNRPYDSSGPQQGVTNGLLVKEMVSGRMQLGDNPYDVDYREASDVPVAGNPRRDNAEGPGYGVFVGVATVDNGYRDAQRLGQRVNTTIDRAGNLGIRDDLARPETEIVQYNSVTGHNIPRIFWDFMNLQGPVMVNGNVTTGPVVDWLFAIGLPITDSYWTRAQVGTADRDVLVQLFERRALTYTPDNPDGYKVEMGNVGQHYFQWRYPQLGAPWAASDPNPPLLFASDMDTGSHWELYAYKSSGSTRLTYANAESVAFSYRRSYNPMDMRILIDSRRSNGQHRQLYELPLQPYLLKVSVPDTLLYRLSYTDGTPVPPNGPYPGWLPNGTANEYNGAYSPDGTKIAFISDRNGTSELYLMGSSGNDPGLLQSAGSGCRIEVPTWSPDGRTLFWESNCDGDFEIYRGDLVYQEDRSYYVRAMLTNVQQLTNNTSDDRFTRVSPDGNNVAFTAYRDGNAEIYVMNADGSNQRRLTSNNAEDEAATWSADGTHLAFASNRDGDYEIFTMNTDGGEQTQLTNNTAQDRWPLWAQ